jgi:hypothetical protein
VDTGFRRKRRDKTKNESFGPDSHFASEALVACATPTPYQVKGPDGGQLATWLGANLLEVSSRGNDATSDRLNRDLTLLRAAESAIAADFRYFVEVSAEDVGESESIPGMITASINEDGIPIINPGVSTYIHRPGLNAYYRMYPGEAGKETGAVYDAYAVYNELGPELIEDFEPKAPPAG